METSGIIKTAETKPASFQKRRSRLIAGEIQSCYVSGGQLLCRSYQQIGRYPHAVWYFARSKSSIVLIAKQAEQGTSRLEVEIERSFDLGRHSSHDKEICHISTRLGSRDKRRRYSSNKGGCVIQHQSYIRGREGLLVVPIQANDHELAIDLVSLTSNESFVEECFQRAKQLLSKGQLGIHLSGSDKPILF